MNLQEGMQQIASIKETIQQRISQNYLMQFIDEPYIDEDRIMILVESLKDHHLPTAIIERFVSTAMLIQIALDTHDKVNNTNESIKPRQLTVLAGDYYSSLYYKMLAEVENVPLIRTLAEGIKLVNEYKVSLYRIDDHDIDGYIHTLKKVESTIVSKFIHFFGCQHLSVLAEEMLLINKLIDENEKVLAGKNSNIFEAIIKLLFPANQKSYHQLSLENKTLFNQTYQKYIDQSKNRIREEMEKIKLNQLLDQRINFLLNQESKENNIWKRAK
ncbi:heptaprenyl diphosphate synthase component 1 [Heyndrickxia sp. NPDC080065]|uniref:heptaprenyl diphosphate synthase component 1 n=1 Tax=Heyndrickxia sp. NPDC080065 TaxID=3390568 RepID=UPI003D0627A7